MHPAHRADLACLLRELRDITEQLLPSCRPRELSTIAAGFARLRAADRRLMQLLLARCPLRALRPQELSQLAWAVAKSQHNPDAAWVEELLSTSQRVLDSTAADAAVTAACGSRAGAAGPAGKQQQPRCAGSRGAGAPRPVVLGEEGFKPQELCNVAWALAVLQRRCALVTGPGPAGGPACARVQPSWFAALRGAALAQLAGFGPGDAAMCLWSLAALGHSPPDAWLGVFAARAAGLAPRMEEPHVAATLWAVSRMRRAAGGAPLGACLCSSSSSSSSISTSSSSNSGGGGSGMPGIPPLGSSSTAEFLQTGTPLTSSSDHLHGRGTSGEATPHGGGGGGTSGDEAAAGVAHLVGALQARAFCLLPAMRRPMLNVTLALSASARMGAPPPAEHVHAMLLRVQALLAWGGAADGHWRSPAAASEHGLAAGQPAAGGGAAARPAAVDRLREHQESERRHTAARERVRQRGWSPRDLATVAWALAALGYRPSDAWLGAAIASASAVLHTFHNRELSLLLHSLVRLRARPPAAFVGAAARVSLSHSASFNAQSAAHVVCALARLRAPRRPGAGQAATLLQVFLSRVDDSVEGTARNVAAVAYRLPDLIRPARLKALPEGAWPRHAPGRELLARLASAARARLRDCSAADLALLAAGFARLRHHPGQEWLEAHARRCAVVDAQFSERERARLEAALAVIAALPKPQEQAANAPHFGMQCL
ncbi:hypothetical protein MNEG_2616 [Monoraphidium neglectum]|uniref:RAP domain-containing protein n=1 Tax=Monoraphidium neglectum TaxID=145388 RepID=A0A0D2MRX1_9CHLO|nr:hypothetical protein MNEG_2616 [Monoraphidium neglectum]KIZ05340.1 hypothetical protein MNEG_2616 [Monoraphidium neglectum]|eukprot:XP_013904359.1 hypothetical protein MNEG_2616 [Monoraphidium neglectum]